MKLLLIVGSANDIFIYNYAKWLKVAMDVTIDVFEFYPSSHQGYGYDYYENVTSAKSCKIPKVKVFIDPYIMSHQLRRFIKNKQYDIIHCHWIVSPLVLVKKLKRHCRKLVMTFWGREYANMNLLGSNQCFRKHLNKLFRDVDAIINEYAPITSQIPSFKGKFYSATLGSAPLDILYDLMRKESKDSSKQTLGISLDKTSILIGYSGKKLHQHLAIIEELRKHEMLKNKVHLIAPMTRGGAENYITEVKAALDKSGFTFSLFSGRFLNDKEVAEIRNATDITLQLSTTDGFSRSIIECLCSKSIVIYGDWLGYEKRLEAAKFQAIPVKSIEQAVGMIPMIVANWRSFKEMVESNYSNGALRYLWSECIKDWVAAYKDLLKD